MGCFNPMMFQLSCVCLFCLCTSVSGFFCGFLLLFMFCVCHAFLSVCCSLVVSCWERTNLLILLYVKFYCIFVTFPCDVLGQMWCLIESIPDLCLFTNFYGAIRWSVISDCAGPEVAIYDPIFTSTITN